MKKTEVLNVIKKQNPKLAKEMEQPNFLGWIILSAYIQEKGNMRDLEIVINEFSEKCYSLIEETKNEITPGVEKAQKEIADSKHHTTFCKITLKCIKIYQKYYNMMVELSNCLGDNIGFDGGIY